jgi:predicted ester cyclase
MSSDATQTLPEQIFAAIEARDFDRIDQLFADDYVEHAAMGDVHGREAFKDFLRGWFAAFPDMTMTVSDVVQEGNIVYWTLSYSGTNTGEFNGMPPTGKHVNVTSALNKGLIRDGKAIEHWQGNDAMELMRQLGMMP